jgi:hypothetical protein
MRARAARARRLSPIRPTFGLTIPLMAVPLEPLGFFLTREAPAFLGVVPSRRLLDLHRAVHRAIEPVVVGIWPYYLPDALLPHCTLAMGVTDKAKVTEILDRFQTPIPALVSGAHLVEVPGARTTTPLTA